jgi:hypothetical protein
VDPERAIATAGHQRRDGRRPSGKTIRATATSPNTGGTKAFCSTALAVPPDIPVIDP